jgi:hypothetical protein
MSNDEDFEIDTILNDIGFKKYEPPIYAHRSAKAKKERKPTPPLVLKADQPVPKKFISSKKIANADGLSADEFPDVSDIPDISLKKGIVPDESLTTLYQKGNRLTKWTQRRAYKFYLDMMKWYNDNPTEYFLIGYYCLKGVNEGAMHEIRKRYPVCQAVYEQLLTMQEYRVLNATALEKIHAGVGRFFLNCRYGHLYTPVKQLQADVKGDLSVEANVNTLPVTIVFEEVSTPVTETNT